MKRIDIIVPAYNEAEGLDDFYKALCMTIDNLAYDFRILFVDDGSTDSTLEKCKAIEAADKRVGHIRLSRNFGHQAALTAGLDKAGGDAVITMDADLEHPPSTIPAFLDAWEKGAMVVTGIRKGQLHVRAFKRISSKGFYALFNRLSNVPGTIESADFRLLDRRVVEAIGRMREQSRFLRGMFAWAGFRQAVVQYEQGQRRVGTPGYTPAKSFKLALEALLSFSRTPLRISIYLGITVSMLAFLYGIYAMAQYFVFQRALPGWTSLAVLISFLSGIQLFTIGVLGEYLGQVLEEVKQRPLYIVEEESLPGEEKQTGNAAHTRGRIRVEDR
ncbi:MAG: glycosyltransferase family 2 protein [Deltaproteobacteria bacterium]|nr:glycosyltransferase family 2 protein [Deltaproteobacteria bacterium]